MYTQLTDVEGEVNGLWTYDRKVPKMDMAKVKVVVNRSTRKGYDIDAEEVEKALGLKISWSVPNDFKNAITAINYGEPVVLRSPRAEMSDSLQGLMQMLNGRSAGRK